MTRADPDPAFDAVRNRRIIDLTQMLSGPYGTMMLADHRAEVIKVEPRRRNPDLDRSPRGDR
jgi:crotonobetainyl-CoA:carnitine CoA-transferase CaiB-like acyl-CoA transferase